MDLVGLIAMLEMWDAQVIVNNLGLVIMMNVIGSALLNAIKMAT